MDNQMSKLLNKCLVSEHPVLLLSAIDIIYPVWNFDKNLSKQVLVQILKKDPRMLISHKTIRLLDFMVKDSDQIFYDLIKSNIVDKKDEFDELRKRIVCYYCYYGIYKDLVDIIIENDYEIVLSCCTQIYKEQQSDKSGIKRTRELILCIPIKGNIKESKSSQIVYSLSDLITQGAEDKIILRFLKKMKSFDDISIHSLTTDLQKSKNLIEKAQVLFSICHIVMKNVEQRPYYVENLVSLIVRLYAEVQDASIKKIKKRCLKLLNQMYDSFAMNTMQAIEKICK